MVLTKFIWNICFILNKIIETMDEEIKKFWEDKGYVIRKLDPDIQYNPNDNRKSFYCIMWLATQCGNCRCVAVSTTIDSSKKKEYEILYNLEQNGLLYSESDMIRIIKLKTFI